MPATPKLLAPTTGPRLIVYHQTIHDGQANYHSLLPLLTNKTGITHVIVAAIHVNDGPGNLTLNDHPPGDKRFEQLWGEVKWLQGSGVKVLGMLGGAAKGTFERLSGGDESFDAYYAPLRDLVRQRRLDGIDLDVEEEMSLPAITRLIARFRSDFGSAFLITLAPVATALLPDPAHPSPRPALASSSSSSSSSSSAWAPAPNALHPTLPHLSGFSYPQLETSVWGREIAWYNTQFYCGWGDASSTRWYDAIVAAGWEPSRVVMGVVTNPANGAGHVPVETLRQVCARLREKYQHVGRGFGGVMGWELFNAGDCDADVVHVARLQLGNEDARTGWVKALGAVLRSETPPPPPSPPMQPPARPGLNLSPEQIRHMVTALPAPSTSWPDDKIEQLLVLGFARNQAVAALNATDGNLELAAGFLFEHDAQQ
ncbi:Cyclin-dependent kinase catalytic subunit [Pleosporales sp. CAS-2024a]